MKKYSLIALILLFLILAESCNWSRFYFRYRRSKKVENIPSNIEESIQKNRSIFSAEEEVKPASR